MHLVQQPIHQMLVTLHSLSGKTRCMPRAAEAHSRPRLVRVLGARLGVAPEVLEFFVARICSCLPTGPSVLPLSQKDSISPGCSYNMQLPDPEKNQKAFLSSATPTGIVKIISSF